jgi:hypothetical protein
MSTPWCNRFVCWPPCIGGSPLRTPAQVLGSNLAIWLQADLGIGVTGPLPVWVNQVPNGNALQDVYAAPPLLVQNAFGNNPGVYFTDVGSGLNLHLATPFAVGDRPFAITRCRLAQLDHTPATSQPVFVAIPDPPPSTDVLSFDAEASGTFDVNSYWNGDTNGQNAFVTLPPPSGDAELLGAHTIQRAYQQSGNIVIDGVSTDTAAPVPALVGPINRVSLGRAPAGVSSGFWTLGVFLMAYTTPTAAQIAELQAYCDGYSFS